MVELDRAVSYVPPLWSRQVDVVMVKGEGPYLWDQAGKRYLDFTSGIGVTNTGHCHPRVVAAIREQAGKVIHINGTIAYHQPMLDLCRELGTVMPRSLDTVFLVNSGAEAVESAVKLARQATHRPNIIAFQRAFHGRTIGAMSLTASRTIYRAGYQPLMAGVFHAPYAYCYRCPMAEANPDKYGFDKDCDWALQQVRFLLQSQTAPEETAAVLVEPVLGEGGYVVPPPRFMTGLRKICDEFGMLLIADEVQTGFGRTGRFFAVEHTQVEPDIMVMSKGIASGMPLAGIATRKELMRNSPPGSHGGTYSGNAVACAAATETVRIIRDGGVLANATRLGVYLLSLLRAMQERHPEMGDVRGLGLMVGVEFVVPGTREPDLARAKAVQAACRAQGLLLLTCGTADNVVRWIPPLIIDDSHLAEALSIFEKALSAQPG